MNSSSSILFTNRQQSKTVGVASGSDDDPASGGFLFHKTEKKYEVGLIIDEEEAIKQRKFRSILNKLSSSNYKKLFAQIRQVHIDNTTTLTGLVYQIYDRALMKSSHSPMYATLCSYLVAKLTCAFTDEHGTITFRRLLINMCQAVFESEEERLKARYRWLCNIRLIGKLRKKGEIPEKIFHECMKMLLFGPNDQNPDELKIEGSCMLISTVGEMIDHPKAKSLIDSYCDKMRDLSNNMKLSSRVRFMLKDVVELRANQWEHTTDDEGDEYHPSSPFYLHPSERTYDVISPILLKGDNYEEWSRSIRYTLHAKNKLGFIDGNIKIPDPQSPDYDQWGIVNCMLVTWVLNTIDVSIRSTIRFPNNVESLWDDLHDRYSIGNGPRILDLKSQISNCKQRGRSVAEYYGELRKLLDKLSRYCKLPTCTCSAAAEFVKMQQTEMLHWFCIGLHYKKFGSVVSKLLSMDPLPSLDVAYALVVSEEQKLLFEAQKTFSQICSHCGKLGHEKEKCFALIGPPIWYRSGSRGGWSNNYPTLGGRSGGRAFDSNTASISTGGSRNVGEAERTSASTLADDQ